MTTAPDLPAHTHAPLILDTNIVLDLLLFKDAKAQQFQAKLELTDWHWIATEAMRDELAHVLFYAHLQPRMAFYQETRDSLLAAFDEKVQLVPAALATPIRCKDQDDQKFIDLAVAHKATLLSKDKHVLKLKKRLAKIDVQVLAAEDFIQWMSSSHAMHHHMATSATT